MTIDVKNLKSRVESVTDLLDDYCQQDCKSRDHMDCFMCPVRRALFEAQSMRLYLSVSIDQLQNLNMINLGGESNPDLWRRIKI